MGKEILTARERKLLGKFKNIDQYKEKNSIGIEILKTITLGGFVASCFLMPGLAYSYKFFSDWRQEDLRKLRRVLKRHIKNGLVEIRDNKAYITKKGSLLLKRDQIKNFTLPEENKNIHAIVIFDIPEKHRYARKILRLKLRSCGFVMIQHSVYARKAGCKNSFFELIDLLEVCEYVYYFETNSVYGLK